MKQFSKRILACAVAAGLAAPMTAFATNGMNLDAYGPIAMGMGGASYAYDNGTAAMMNNPATLGLMSDGNRLDVALGFLGPDVKTTMGGVTTKSSADSFYMPAVGWAKRAGRYTYGVGMFAQGGMGTEYSANSPLAVGSGQEVMSQVSVGRIMAPLVYKVNSKLNVGGSLDFVWANMDLRMALPTTMIPGLVTGYTGGWGAALPGLASYNWGRFDFADSSNFTGAAKGRGFAAKLGLTYQVNPQLTLGVTYHSETSLSDLKAPATMSAGNFGGPAAMTIPGTIKVKDFQWPSTYGIGLAYKPNNRWLIAADYKRINWSNVMDNFKMSFYAPSMGGDLNVALPQKWKDQNVFELGASYQANQKWTIRAGANLSDNPIPDTYVNYLFPATVKDGYMAGVGYAIDKKQSVNFAIADVPAVTVTAGSGAIIKHSQLNWQLMYSNTF